MRYENAMVGVNRRNDEEPVINGWLSRNCMKKTRMFPEIGYRYVHKYCTYIMVCVWNTTLTTRRRLEITHSDDIRTRRWQGCEVVVHAPITFLVASGFLCDILTQDLIRLIEYSYHQGIPSFLEAHLQRTPRLSVFGLKQFQDG
jgi:hypothetical protein